MFNHYVTEMPFSSICARGKTRHNLNDNLELHNTLELTENLHSLLGTLSTVLTCVQRMFLLVTSWEVQKTVYFSFQTAPLVVPTSLREGTSRRSVDLRYIQWVQFFIGYILQSTSTFISWPQVSHPAGKAARQDPSLRARGLKSWLLGEVTELLRDTGRTRNQAFQFLSHLPVPSWGSSLPFRGSEGPLPNCGYTWHGVGPCPWPPFPRGTRQCV